MDKDQIFKEIKKSGKYNEYGEPVISPEDIESYEIEKTERGEVLNKRNNQTYLIESIIKNRKEILELVAKHGVTALRLYGSVLARKETPQSDIDFLAIFDSSTEYDWEARFRVQDDLEAYFNRIINVVDSRRIPNVFRPSIDIDPVDIMDLSSSKQYSITPKTSKLYYLMLDREFSEYNINDTDNDSDFVYMLLAENVSWWFSRLLRLDDNDLKGYKGFYYVEVLKLCENLSPLTLLDYSGKDLERFKELVEEIRKYVDFHNKYDNDK